MENKDNNDVCSSNFDPLQALYSSNSSPSPEAEHTNLEVMSTANIKPELVEDCSSNFNPLQALYSSDAPLPVKEQTKLEVISSANIKSELFNPLAAIYSTAPSPVAPLQVASLENIPHEIDIVSDSFDPLKAIYSGVPLPISENVCSKNIEHSTKILSESFDPSIASSTGISSSKFNPLAAIYSINVPTSVSGDVSVKKNATLSTDISRVDFDPMAILYSNISHVPTSSSEDLNRGKTALSIPDPPRSSEASSTLHNVEQSSLDPKTKHFDPVKAIYSKHVIIPVPNAPILDNIGMYVSKAKNTSHGRGNKPGPSSSAGNVDMPIERRFLPHQMPVRAPRPAKLSRNILTRMLDTKQGPLSVLKDCMERRIRVKVYTRDMNSVRGYCLGFVVAFDKHWNLALEDVTEIWTRKKIGKRKVPALGADALVEVSEWTAEGTPRPRPPCVVVRKTSSKGEEVERHVQQLMIRGEQVVIIAIVD